MLSSGGPGSGARRKKLSLAILVVLPVLAVLFFYPKELVLGGLRGGPVAPGEVAYREDYSCIGIPYDFCPNWPDYGCDYLCFGMVAERTCTLEIYDVSEGLSREPVDCEGPARPGWGFPAGFFEELGKVTGKIQ